MRRHKKWQQSAKLLLTICVCTIIAIVIFVYLVRFWGNTDPLSPGWLQQGANKGIESRQSTNHPDPSSLPALPKKTTNSEQTVNETAPLDVTKVTLTIISGIGAVGYLVIKFRERAGAEREEYRADRRDAEARLASAADQLGNNSPQVRIAGVYALADVADTYRGGYKQRVVDILCGYLRTERGQWEATTGDEDENTIVVNGRRCLQTDGPVESTVLSVLARHLRKARKKTMEHEAVTQEVDDDQLWCACNLDLHGAIIVEVVSLRGVLLEKRANFSGTHFHGPADFSAAQFNGDTHFQETQFHSGTEFQNAQFHGITHFLHARFHCYTEFWDAQFQGRADFSHAQFHGSADFQETHFHYSTDFGHAQFHWSADFSDAQFHWSADFSHAQFHGSANFQETHFHNKPEFQGAVFNGLLRDRSTVSFPQKLLAHSDNDLPQGASWATLISNE